MPSCSTRIFKAVDSVDYPLLFSFIIPKGVKCTMILYSTTQNDLISHSRTIFLKISSFFVQKAEYNRTKKPI